MDLCRSVPRSHIHGGSLVITTLTQGCDRGYHNPSQSTDVPSTRHISPDCVRMTTTLFTFTGLLTVYLRLMSWLNNKHEHLLPSCPLSPPIIRYKMQCWKNSKICLSFHIDFLSLVNFDNRVSWAGTWPWSRRSHERGVGCPDPPDVPPAGAGDCVWRRWY